MTNMQPTTPTLLTKKQVAAMLKVSTRAVNRMVTNGQFPTPMKRGTGYGHYPRKLRCLWFEADVIAYMDKMAATPGNRS